MHAHITSWAPTETGERFCERHILGRVHAVRRQTYARHPCKGEIADTLLSDTKTGVRAIWSAIWTTQIVISTRMMVSTLHQRQVIPPSAWRLSLVAKYRGRNDYATIQTRIRSPRMASPTTACLCLEGLDMFFEFMLQARVRSG